MDLHDEVKLVHVRVEPKSRLFNSLQSEVLRSYSKRNDFADVMLSSFHHLIRIGCGVRTVLRRDFRFLKLLLQ